MRIAVAFLCLSFLSACTTTRYVTAPTTAKVSEHVAVASARVDSVSNRVASAQRSSDSGKTHVVSAIAKIQAMRDAAAAEKNTAEMAQFDSVLQDLTAGREDFDRVILELKGAQTEIFTLRSDLSHAKAATDTLQQKLDEKSLVDQKNADELARLQALEKRVNSWFHLGAIFYGVEGLLKAGIVGILILTVGLAALIFFVPAVLPFFKGAPVWLRIRRKPPPS